MASGTYQITVKFESEGKKSPIAGSGTTPTDTGGGGVSDTRKAIGKGLISYRSYVKPFVNQLVSQQINTVSLRTGAQELQDRLSFGYQMIQSGVNMVESIAIGAMMGGAAGAVVGAVMSVTTTAISYAHKQSVLDMNRSLEDITISGRNIRAGGSISTFKSSRETVQ